MSSASSHHIYSDIDVVIKAIIADNKVWLPTNEVRL